MQFQHLDLGDQVVLRTADGKELVIPGAGPFHDRDVNKTRRDRQPE